MKRIVVSALVLVFISSGIGCKKNNDKQPVCKLSGVNSDGGQSHDEFIYDSDGKLERIVNGYFSIVFSYAGNTKTVISVDSGKIRTRSFVTLNADGLATNARTESYQPDSTWSNNAYEYNGTELSRSTFTSSSGGAPLITTYQWSDHDMVAEVSGRDTSTYDYYPDKARQEGDYFLLVQTLQGAESIRNKHLLRSASGTTFTYDLRPDGKISSLAAVTSGTISYLDYIYACD